MRTKFLREQNTALSELHFDLAGLIYGYDIDAIYNGLFKSGLDKNTHGFWVWDIRENKEIYSPRFREVLGYSDESDFPNVPKSWMDAIDSDSMVSVMDAYRKHIDTKGEYEYNEKVKYYKKDKSSINLLCYGKVVLWDGEDPLVMVGVHMDISGLYIAAIDKFKSKLNIDVTLQGKKRDNRFRVKDKTQKRRWSYIS